MGRFPLGAEFCFSEKHLNSCVTGVDRDRRGRGKGKALRGRWTPKEKDRGALTLIWVKSCRSRSHLGCAGLKARSAPAESQDF